MEAVGEREEIKHTTPFSVVASHILAQLELPVFSQVLSHGQVSSQSLCSVHLVSTVWIQLLFKAVAALQHFVQPASPTTAAALCALTPNLFSYFLVTLKPPQNLPGFALNRCQMKATVAVNWTSLKVPVWFISLLSSLIVSVEWGLWQAGWIWIFENCRWFQWHIIKLPFTIVPIIITRLLPFSSKSFNRYLEYLKFFSPPAPVLPLPALRM